MKQYKILRSLRILENIYDEVVLKVAFCKIDGLYLPVTLNEFTMISDLISSQHSSNHVNNKE